METLQSLQKTPGPDSSRQSAFLRAILVASALLIGSLFVSAGLEFTIAPDQKIPVHQVAAAASARETSSQFQNISLEAKAAYVSDLSTGKVLYERSADTQLPLASITKVPLVLIISEVLAVSDTVIISRDAVIRGEGGGLGTGDTWRIKDLIDFTLLASSNAGAEALADAANEKLRAKYPGAPETHSAVWRMNELAKDLGLTRTYFLNPSGLDASGTQPGAVSSARDVATLFTYASRAAPELFDSTVRGGLSLGPLNGKPKPALNTNEALPDIPGLIMGKTGYTDLAGGNLAIVFEASGHAIVAVVLGSSRDGRFADMKKIVETVREGPS